MALRLKITQFEKGPTLNLVVVITSQNTDYYDGSVISNTFQIADLAMVRLKFKLSSINEEKLHIVSISTMKHASVQEPAVKMIVTCNALKYSEKWDCSENWTEWIDMGRTKPDKIFETVTGNRRVAVYLLTMEISIRVQKIFTSAFTQLYDDPDSPDYLLSTSDGGTVPVHKAVLMMHSEKFRGRSAEEWNENPYKISSCSLETVQHLKDFMYLGTLPDYGLRQLLALAVRFSIKDLIKECSWQLAETVSPKDFYSLHKFACEHDIPQLSYALT